MFVNNNIYTYISLSRKSFLNFKARCHNEFQSCNILNPTGTYLVKECSHQPFFFESMLKYNLIYDLPPLNELKVYVEPVMFDGV